MRMLDDAKVDNMRRYFSIFCLVCSVFSVTGCSNVSEEELQEKINKCTDAGMNYTYLRDFRGEAYEVMCVSKRLH
jgi:hypothetical protein